LVVGHSFLLPPVFVGSAHGAGLDYQYFTYSIVESLLRRTDADPPLLGDPTGKAIAESFELAPDFSTITFKIREGVKFNNWKPEWGDPELTAHDVVFSYNEALYTEDTVFYKRRNHIWYEESWEAPNDRTAIMHLIPGQFSPGWWARHGTEGHEGAVPMFSEKVFNALGKDKALTSMVATGPFRAVKWVGEEELVAEAVPDHWRNPPHVEEFRLVVIPEAITKVAAFETGEIHIALIDIQFLQDLRDSVAGTQVKFPTAHHTSWTWFGGNYWAKKDPVTGEDVPRRPGFKPDDEHPWIGDPDDPERMENARKVRLALALAVDKEAIADNVYLGLSQTACCFHTRFQAEKDKLGDLWNPDWFIPFDPDQAKQLLAEAGYPDGFRMPYWNILGSAAVPPEVGDAVAQEWINNLGLDVVVEKIAYPARRPSLVDRNVDYPFQFNGNNLKWDDEATGRSLFPAVGFNILEVPADIAQVHFDNVTATDPLDILKNNVFWENYFREWSLGFAQIYLEYPFLLRPEVLEWKPYTFAWRDFNSPETVVMR
jgi:ABC-type transport system substrate-binding protein